MPSIRAAAAAAGIDEFITTLPQGYHTLVGKGGTDLSGGQAQRVAIARAVVRRPQLLIMDEATSGLDGESASGVRAMVHRLRAQGVGVVVVTHDRDMMRACQEVVVLGKGGVVVEKGGFDDLLARRGHFWNLVGGGST